MEDEAGTSGCSSRLVRSREMRPEHLALTQFRGVSEPRGSTGLWWLIAPKSSFFGWALGAEMRGRGCVEKHRGV